MHPPHTPCDSMANPPVVWQPTSNETKKKPKTSNETKKKPKTSKKSKTSKKPKKSARPRRSLRAIRMSDCLLIGLHRWLNARQRLARIRTVSCGTSVKGINACTNVQALGCRPKILIELQTSGRNAATRTESC